MDSLDDALKVALTGQNKRVDVGRLTVDHSGEDEHPKEHIFLIMAGVGFDAAIMADAPERLKRTVGPLAYTFSGVKNLRGPQFKVRIKIDDEPEFSRRARSVVIGNCGKITGGLVLMPQAQVDDGWLDAVILSPVGVVGWVAVAGRVISQKRKGHERVDHHRLKSVTIRFDPAAPEASRSTATTGSARTPQRPVRHRRPAGARRPGGLTCGLPPSGVAQTRKPQPGPRLDELRVTASARRSCAPQARQREGSQTRSHARETRRCHAPRAPRHRRPADRTPGSAPAAVPSASRRPARR